MKYIVGIKRHHQEVFVCKIFITVASCSTNFLSTSPPESCTELRLILSVLPRCTLWPHLWDNQLKPLTCSAAQLQQAVQGLRILMCTYLCNPSKRRDAFRQPTAYIDACYLCNKLCERDWSSYISAPSLYVKPAWDSTAISSWPSSLFSRGTCSNARILPIYGVFYSLLQSFMGECKHIAVRTLIDISSLIGRGKNVPCDMCKDCLASDGAICSSRFHSSRSEPLRTTRRGFTSSSCSHL